MGATEIQIVDAAARVMLPKDFADATVAIERLSETEIRICKTGAIP
jgi:hypothetical protein